MKSNQTVRSSIQNTNPRTEIRQGYLSRRVATLKPSGIRKFFDIAATMKDVISLGIGEPDFDTPPPIIEAGINSLRRGETHYTSNAGILELRQEISSYLNRLYGVEYNPETEILVTVGASEGLYLAATSILDPGDEVIIPTPCYVAYQAEVELAGGVPVEVPGTIENNFDLEIDAIARAITPKTKAILIGYPNNPTGAVASREKLVALARLAEENDLVVISDEIYDRLVYGVEHICFPGLDGMKKRSILTGGFSKSYAMTGWRIGYVTGPAELMEGLTRVHQYTIMCASTTAQVAAMEGLRSAESFVMEMHTEFDRRRRLVYQGLSSIGFPIFEPKGAFYAFPKVSVTGLDDTAFAEQLLAEEKVAVVPGSAFGKGGEGFVRCSYATSYEKLEQAIERIARFSRRIDGSRS